MHLLPHKNPWLEFQQRLFQIEEGAVSFETPRRLVLREIVNGRVLKGKEP